MQANTDHFITTGAARRGGRPFDDWLKRQLHDMYDPITREPLPGDLACLVEDYGNLASGTGGQLLR